MAHKFTYQAIASAAFALASVFGIAAPASAYVIADGPYAIEIHRLVDDPYVGGKYAGCMMVSNNGQDAVPSLYSWDDGTGNTFCGLSGNGEVMMQNRQAVWQIQSVWASNGEHAYIVRSHVNGRCLIRGNRGKAANPSLHLWTEYGPDGDPNYCGLRSADELIRNGQAAWSFDASALGWAARATSITNRGPWQAQLGFERDPLVYPNTIDRSVYASFTQDASRWLFTFWPMDFWPEEP